VCHEDQQRIQGRRLRPGKDRWIASNRAVSSSRPPLSSTEKAPPTKAAVATGGDPARVSGKLVSADYFQVFGVKLQIGRTFTVGEDQPGAASVVVLSHAFWQTQFAGDPSVLNRNLMLDGEPHNRIIGVLPAGSFDRDEAVFWKPLIFARD